MRFKHLPTTIRTLALIVFTTITTLALAGCGGAEPADDSSDGGVRLVSANDAAALLSAEGDSLVLIDVRTPDEFNESHLDGAKLIDFYEADFADDLAELDRDRRYVIYCRSGNRSGQTRQIMIDLGFTNVVDIDGGITAWQAQGHATVG